MTSQKFTLAMTVYVELTYLEKASHQFKHFYQYKVRSDNPEDDQLIFRLPESLLSTIKHQAILKSAFITSTDPRTWQAVLLRPGHLKLERS